MIILLNNYYYDTELERFITPEEAKAKELEPELTSPDGYSKVLIEKTQCPTCGEQVESIFDHVDIDCHHD